jgi:hypothetical protein
MNGDVTLMSAFIYWDIDISPPTFLERNEKGSKEGRRLQNRGQAAQRALGRKSEKRILPQN